MNLNSGNFAEAKPRYGTEWEFKSGSDPNRSVNEVLIESELKDALIRLNPEIQANLNLADEVIYKLSVILISVEKVDLVIVNSKIIMNQFITSANHLPPFYGRMGSFKLVINFLWSLPDDF